MLCWEVGGGSGDAWLGEKPTILTAPLHEHGPPSPALCRTLASPPTQALTHPSVLAWYFPTAKSA